MKIAPYFDRVWEVARQIPPGRVTTYGAIASYLGLGSARMTGWALHHSDTQPDVPAHRVVNRLGLLSGRVHFATPTLMQELLATEGVVVTDDTVQNFNTVFWNPNTELGERFAELAGW